MVPDVDLERFVAAQRNDFDRALSEIEAGRKRSHWMWYVFPQVIGLGLSPTSRRFAIESVDEARAFLAHPVLGDRTFDVTLDRLLDRKRKMSHNLLMPPVSDTDLDEVFSMAMAR